MTYHVKSGLIVPFIQKYYKVLIGAVLGIMLLTVALLTLSASAASTINITNVTELRYAIENQSDGDTWNIQAGEYGLEPFTGLLVSGQTGWYFPITANNLTINGVGNPTIYGTGFSVNGNWATQNLVSVFGDNVTINGLTLMPKIEPNKTIEVLGSDFTLTNTVFSPNSLTDASEYTTAWADADQWGGSLYFSHEGNHTVENVTINNAGISFRYAPSGTNITFNNVTLDYETDVDWINQYRYSSAFNNSGNSKTGDIKVVYHINNALNNLDVVLNSIADGDFIELDSNITTSEQMTLNKSVYINGNGNTIDAAFAKTTNSNNSAIGVQADNVEITNLTVDGQNGTDLHGINVYESLDVLMDGVTSKNFRSGIALNSSTGTLRNISTSGNIWHGINVDTRTAQIAELTIENVSSHDENSPSPPSGFVDGVHVPHIFIDDATDGSSVNDVNSQYDVAEVDFRGGRALVYTLKYNRTAEITAPSGNAVVNGLIDFTAYLDDNDADNIQWAIREGTCAAGTNTVFGNVDGHSDVATIDPSNLASQTFSFTADTTTINDGMHCFIYNPVEDAGESNIRLTREFYVDNNSPEVSNIVLNGQAVSLSDVREENCDPIVNLYAVSGEIDLSATITDIAGDVSNARYRVRKVNSNGCTQSSIFSSGNVNMSNTTGDTWEDLNGFDTNGVPADGEYTIRLQTTDTNGNTTTRFIDILVDNTAPEAPTLLSPGDGVPVDGTIPLANDWNDVLGAEYYIYTSYNVAIDQDCSEGTFRFTDNYIDSETNTRALPDGLVYCWEVRAVDAAGNVSPASERWKTISSIFVPQVAAAVDEKFSEEEINSGFTGTSGSQGVLAATTGGGTNTDGQGGAVLADSDTLSDTGIPVSMFVAFGLFLISSSALVFASVKKSQV